MLYAVNQEGLKVAPKKGGRAFCPACNTEAYAQCDLTNVVHLAHDSVETCDDWKYEPKTFWHLNW
jgi:competence CoiA-like predicted nuclease